MACVSCEIIARELPGYIITEDRNFMVWLSLENHPLIVPKRHVPDIFGLPDDLASSIMRLTKKVAMATKSALEADGIYITQANGTSAGQSVFHYHMHVYPRWSDGRLLETDDLSKTRTMEKIHECFSRCV